MPEVLIIRAEAAGQGPSVFKTEGTVFLYKDRPRPVNNFFFMFFLNIPKYLKVFAFYLRTVDFLIIIIEADKFG